MIEYLENEDNENLIIEHFSEDEIIQVLDFSLAIHLGEQHFWGIVTTSYEMIKIVRERFLSKTIQKHISSATLSQVATEQETLH